MKFDRLITENTPFDCVDSLQRLALHWKLFRFISVEHLTNTRTALEIPVFLFSIFEHLTLSGVNKWSDNDKIDFGIFVFELTSSGQGTITATFPIFRICNAGTDFRFATLTLTHVARVRYPWQLFCNEKNEMKNHFELINDNLMWLQRIVKYFGFAKNDQQWQRSPKHAPHTEHEWTERKKNLIFVVVQLVSDANVCMCISGFVTKTQWHNWADDKFTWARMCIYRTEYNVETTKEVNDDCITCTLKCSTNFTRNNNQMKRNLLSLSLTRSLISCINERINMIWL